MQEYRPEKVPGRWGLSATGQAYVQGDAGQPGTCKWQSLDGEKCGNDSPTMTQSGICSARESASVTRGKP